MNRVVLFALADLPLIFCVQSAAAQATFSGLGISGQDSKVDVSANGLVVVGEEGSSPGAWRWTAANGAQSLGDFSGGSNFSAARGTSSDGEFVVGFGETGSGTEAFRWVDLNQNDSVDAGEVLDLHSEFALGVVINNSAAHGVSGDGAVVVGFGNNEAFHWNATDGLQDLGDFAGGDTFAFALGVSDDGNFVVGFGTITGNIEEAFRWEDVNQNGAVDVGETLDLHSEYSLGRLPGDNNSAAFGISSDGFVVVGESGSQAFRWTSGGGMVGLGDLPGGGNSSIAFDVSGDGFVVVGEGDSASGNDAFIWDPVHGMRNLRDVLVDDYGLDLTGWTLESATGISDDGRTIVGTGINPSTNSEAWIATLPELTPVPALGAIGQLVMGVSLLGFGIRASLLRRHD